MKESIPYACKSQSQPPITLLGISQEHQTTLQNTQIRHLQVHWSLWATKSPHSVDSVALFSCGPYFPWVCWSFPLRTILDYFLNFNLTFIDFFSLLEFSPFKKKLFIFIYQPQLPLFPSSHSTTPPPSLRLPIHTSEKVRFPMENEQSLTHSAEARIFEEFY